MDADEIKGKASLEDEEDKKNLKTMVMEVQCNICQTCRSKIVRTRPEILFVSAMFYGFA